jgi:hypothetical protein
VLSRHLMKPICVVPARDGRLGRNPLATKPGG